MSLYQSEITTFNKKNIDCFEIDPGMPLEIFIDKYSRKKENGEYQNYSERISEVIGGNFLLDTRDPDEFREEFEETMELGLRGLLPLAGRHLQHGDLDQLNKVGELFTNCSSGMFCFTKFFLLLKGSGVGRCYDSDACWVDWDFMPNCRFVLSSAHPDYESWIESLEEAQHKYDSEGEDVRWFDVGDTAEGWVKIVSIMETAAFHKNNKDRLFIFNLSNVRKKGTPIIGQQGRPASGPVPLIVALNKVTTIKGAGYKPWKQALFIDHYLSSCVALGGIRRSARMAVKYWKDRDIIDFIDVKRGGWLYTANNSILVDEEFWEQARNPKPSHGRRVYEAAVSAAYYDETGEPGFINVDKLMHNETDLDKITVDNYISNTYQARLGGIHYKTKEMIAYTLEKIKAKKYWWIVNPCAEISFAAFGAYCIVGSVGLANALTLNDARRATKMIARMLIRINTMPFLYSAEVARTNRIGTSLIGLHEFAANMFGYNFYDLINEKKSQDFWNFLAELRDINNESACFISDKLGLNHPHTDTCLVPAGTVAKTFNCTEAANLPAMPYYMRWVQFQRDNPILKNYAERGYPVRDISKDEVRVEDNGSVVTLKGYANVCIVGFPTEQKLAQILGDRVVCADEVSIEDHFRWLELLEKYWLGEGRNNQISYTLKYNPKKVSYQDFMNDMLKYQPKVRCCAVMPQTNNSAYIYVPEERISREDYYNWLGKIKRADRESVDESTLNCDTGACAVDVSMNASAAEAFEAIHNV